MDQNSMYSPSFEYISPDRNKRKIKTFVIASVILGGLAFYAFTNMWLYRLGQMSVNTGGTSTMFDKLQGYIPSSSPDVLGESQVRDQLSRPPSQGSTFNSIKKTIITACDPSGKCNSYSNPAAAGCPITFTDTTCNNQCGDLTKRCRDY